jgi:hypothetical protein
MCFPQKNHLFLNYSIKLKFRLFSFNFWWKKIIKVSNFDFDSDQILIILLKVQNEQVAFCKGISEALESILKVIIIYKIIQ